MKIWLSFFILFFYLPAWAGQQVWLDESQKMYDPADPYSRPAFKTTMPFPENDKGKGYRVTLYHVNGKLALEGFTPTPYWDERLLIGDVSTYFPSGNLQSESHYLWEEDNCACGHTYAIKEGRFVAYFDNGQLRYERHYSHNQLLDGDYEEYDAQGRLALQYTKINGRYEGVINRYENGKLVQQANYKDGQRDGLLVRFENGQPVLDSLYKAGRRDGLQKTYSPDGQLLTEYHYEDGRKKGIQTEFYANGRLKKKWTAGTRGLPEGIQSEYNEKGVLTRRITKARDDAGRVTSTEDKQYDNEGRLKYVRKSHGDYRLEEKYNEAGDLISRSERDDKGLQGLSISKGYNEERAHYLDGELHGDYYKHIPNSSTIKGHFTHGERDGLRVETLANGIRIETHYKNGTKHGQYQVLSPEGERLRYAKYVNGKLHGEVNIFDDYGDRIVGEYKLGKRNGSFKRYTGDDRLLEQGQYSDDEPDGPQYQFSMSGRMESKKTYDHGVPDGEWLETNRNGEVVRRQLYRDGEIVSAKTD